MREENVECCAWFLLEDNAKLRHVDKVISCEDKENNIIPDNAVRIGVNPINGTAESNDNGVLPLGIKEEAEKLFRTIILINMLLQNG